MNTRDLFLRACDAADAILAPMTGAYGRLMEEAPNYPIRVRFGEYEVLIPAYKFNALYNATDRDSKSAQAALQAPSQKAAWEAMKEALDDAAKWLSVDDRGECRNVTLLSLCHEIDAALSLANASTEEEPPTFDQAISTPGGMK